MTVRVEIWPVAADQVSLWLLSGNQPWQSGPVMADNEPHAELEYILSEHGVLQDAMLLHSTSWRVEGPSVILTYIAAITVHDLIRAAWPGAAPINLELAEVVGKPIPHTAIDAPTPRHIDVLLHGLRHIRFLQDTDSTNAGALDSLWRKYLAELSPAFATMYNDRDVRAT